MPSPTAESFARQHPFLPSSWGPQARADIPWNAPQLPDVNPAALVINRIRGETYFPDPPRNLLPLVRASQSQVSALEAGGGAVTLPFRISNVSPDASTPTINVLYGTVTDIAPTDIGTDIVLTDSATNTVYLDLTLDADGIPTAVALLVATTGLPASDDTHAYKLVGTVVVDGAGLITTMNQSLYFSQGFQACGRDADDIVATPGVYQFFVD